MVHSLLVVHTSFLEEYYDIWPNFELLVDFFQLVARLNIDEGHPDPLHVRGAALEAPHQLPPDSFYLFLTILQLNNTLHPLLFQPAQQLTLLLQAKPYLTEFGLNIADCMSAIHDLMLHLVDAGGPHLNVRESAADFLLPH